MGAIRYAVLQIGDEWRVVCERRRIGRFIDRDSAVSIGAGLAREALAAGHVVEFMVQGPCGELFAQQFRAVDHVPANPGRLEEDSALR